MEENQISLSSLFMAYVRGYHAMHDCPKIFDDYLGYHLMTNETRAIIEHRSLICIPPCHFTWPPAVARRACRA